MRDWEWHPTLELGIASQRVEKADELVTKQYYKSGNGTDHSQKTGAMESSSASLPPAKRVKLDWPQDQDSSIITDTNTHCTTSTVTAVASRLLPHDGSSSTALELKVGIKEYINPSHTGFTGILKQRYTDFLVHEITLEGEVLHLRCLNAPNWRKEGQDKRIGVDEKRLSKTRTWEAVEVEQKNSVQPGEENSRNATVVKDIATDAQLSRPTPAPTPDITISEEDKSLLLSFLSEESLDSLLTLFSALTSATSSFTGSLKAKPIFSNKIDSKDTRTFVHHLIRRVFSGKFETTTLEGPVDEGIISITVSRNTGFTTGGQPERGSGFRGRRGGKAGRRPRDNGGNADPYPNGQYLHFTLHKENRDTMDVINILGRVLNLPRQVQQKTFAFAGTKDKRAVTVQRVSALKISPERLAATNFVLARGGARGGRRGMRVGAAVAAGLGLPRGCRVGDFEWRHLPLELGDLKGNEFLITLRDVAPMPSLTGTGSAETLNPQAWDSLTIAEQEVHLRQIVSAAMQGLEQNGFVNYYGLQRFGTFTKGTHEVGIKMLNMDWRGAVEEIMHFDPVLCALPNSSTSEKLQVSRDESDRARACKIFLDMIAQESLQNPDWEKSFQEALVILPKKFLAESAIITAAKDRVGGSSAKLDWLQMLMRIPRGLRLMYIHSYQSYIWNHVASERISRFGLSVVEGDLVLVDNVGSEEASDAHDADMVDQDGESIIRDTSTPAIITLSDKLTRSTTDETDSSFQQARALSAQEASTGTYTIWDIVLPTPGYDVTYPANSLMQVYTNLMAESGLDPMKMRRNVREVSLSGAYRKVVGGVLGKVEWDVKKVRGLEQCVETDLERVERECRVEARMPKMGCGDKGERREEVEGVEKAEGAQGESEGWEVRDCREEGGQRKNSSNEVMIHHISSIHADEQPHKNTTDADDGCNESLAPAAQEPNSQTQEPPQEELPQKLAIVLKFQLGTSMYATMALREVMKASGVQSYQPEFGHTRAK